MANDSVVVRKSVSKAIKGIPHVADGVAGVPGHGIEQRS
jgi:hypothetical protein